MAGIHLTIDTRGLDQLQARIQGITAELPVEVLRIRRERGNAAATLQAEARETLDELTPFDVFDKRLAQEQLDDALRAQLTARYASVVASLQEGTA